MYCQHLTQWPRTCSVQCDQADMICQTAVLKGRPTAGSGALCARADCLQAVSSGVRAHATAARDHATSLEERALDFVPETHSFATARYKYSWERGARKGAAELALRTPAVQHWTCHADSAPSARKTTRPLVHQYNSSQCDMAAGDVHFSSNENAKRHGRSAAIAAGPYRHTA